jgi:purine-binding chemotaxis protein CheW
MDEKLREQDREEDMFIEDDAEENAQANKYLLFNLVEDVYGIGIASVTEIIEMQRITDVPDMPSYVKGVINLRGRVIPVIDLRLRFGMDERAYDDRTCIIIVSVQDSTMGLIVDTVAEVLDIPEADVEPPPNFKIDSGSGRYISGIAKVGEDVKIIIDVSQILKEQDFETISTGT